VFGFESDADAARATPAIKAAAKPAKPVARTKAKRKAGKGKRARKR
jgi:hypothetical protein